jgi:superfamily I DNA/RNA helicase
METTITRRSPQQETIRDWALNETGSARVIAVAGAGKTTTLVDLVKELRGSVAMVAYNKKIADELKERIGSDLRNVRAGTFHSFGFGAWRQAHPKVRVDADKVKKICAAMNVREELVVFVTSLVSLAKQRAVGVIEMIDADAPWRDIVAHFDLDAILTGDKGAVVEDALLEEGITAARAVLRASMTQDPTVIDFDDMIFAPLAHNARVWANDWVLVDEAQDTNPCRRAFVKKMLKAGGRAIFVGDPAQAIYGFTGADNDALDVIAREFNTIDLPLTVSWRCARAVVEVARRYSPLIEASEMAPEGSATTMDEGTFVKEAFTADDAILCRNTKPLVENAFRLIRRGVACHVEGRDLGAGLVVLVKRWKKAKTVADVMERVADWSAKEVEKLLAKGQEMKAERITDKADTLRVIAEACDPDAAKETMVTKINGLFGDNVPNLTLSTIHKAKGREWAKVYWLGANRYQPSPFARQAWQFVQETNLMYVAATRAKRDLIEVRVPLPTRRGGAQ